MPDPPGAPARLQAEVSVPSAASLPSALVEPSVPAEVDAAPCTRPESRPRHAPRDELSQPELFTVARMISLIS